MKKNIFMKIIICISVILQIFSVSLTCLYAEDLQKPLTRAQFVSIVELAFRDVEIAPINESNGFNGEVVFKDLKKGDPYYDHIVKAVQKGYISGYPDGTFKPGVFVKFEDMITMMSKLIQMPSSVTSNEIQNIRSKFKDYESISPYAVGYIIRNINMGYIESYGDSSIRPKQTVTQAAAYSYISRILENNLAYGLNINGNNKQLLIVTADNYSDNIVRIHAYQRNQNGVWQNQYNFNGYIGENGFSDNRRLEGKRYTPTGLFTIGTTFGTGAKPGTTMPYRKIQNDDVWVDDPESSLYNTWQKRGDNKGRWKSAENMNITPYALGFVIDYNTAERIPYAGSAFFFHIYSKPTFGCVGTNYENVRTIINWLSKEASPLILMCPKARIKDF